MGNFEHVFKKSQNTYIYNETLLQLQTQIFNSANKMKTLIESWTEKLTGIIFYTNVLYSFV